MKLLRLLPIGDLDGRLLTDLAPAPARTFPVPWEVIPVRLDPEFAYHGERHEFHSSEILQSMQAYVSPDSGRVLGMTMVDLYIPILTFVFGEAQIGGLCGSCVCSWLARGVLWACRRLQSLARTIAERSGAAPGI